MNRDHYPMYAAGAAVVMAVWAGMPVGFLLFLACPLLMFFMMKEMGGMQANTHAPPPASTVTPPVHDAERR